MANTSILGIIIGKLYYKKKPCPIILLEVNQGLKIGFNHIILPLSQTVRLQVKVSKKFLLNA